MKDKIINYLKENKGGFSLLVFTLVVTLLFGLTLGALVGGCFGTLSLIGLGYVASKVGMQFGDSNRPGIVGIVLGVLISLI